MNKSRYNETYKVKPRYFEAYKKTGLYIITKDKAIFKNTLRYVKGAYKAFTVTRQGGAYIIQSKGQVDILALGFIGYAVLFAIIALILF